MAELYAGSKLKAKDDFFQAIYAYIEKSAQEGKLGAELGIEDFSKLITATVPSDEILADRLQLVLNYRHNKETCKTPKDFYEEVLRPINELKDYISQYYAGELHDDSYSVGSENPTFTVRFGANYMPGNGFEDKVKKILAQAEWDYINSANNALEDYRYNKDTGEKLAGTLAGNLSESPARKYEELFG